MYSNIFFASRVIDLLKVEAYTKWGTYFWPNNLTNIYKITNQTDKNLINDNKKTPVKPTRSLVLFICRPTIKLPNKHYLQKDNNTNTRRCETSSKFTIKTPEWHHWRRAGVFIDNCEYSTSSSSAFTVDFEQVNIYPVKRQTY